MDLAYYNSYLEVDFAVINDAYRKVLDQLDGRCDIMPVVKANAYGQGIVELSSYFVQNMGVSILACAQTCEGIKLREHGLLNTEILLMGPPPIHAVSHAVAYRLHTPVFNTSNLQALNSAAKQLGLRAKAHIKIETGMNRIGVKAGEPLNAFLQEVKKAEHVDIVGVFTHFTNATVTDDSFTPVQFELFKSAVAQVRAQGIEPKYIHCSNTGALSWYKEPFDFATHVRPGSILTGYASMDDYTNHLGVSEACSWRTFITNINEIEAGESVGYSHHFVAQRKTKVATVGIGYADGLYRPMAQDGGPVILNDTRTRYLSTSMDQTMIDATDIPCQIGDEVTIFGRSKGGAMLKLEEIEQFTGQTLAYPMATISDRVKRIYLF